MRDKGIRLSPKLSRIAQIVPTQKMWIGVIWNVEYKAISADNGIAQGLGEFSKNLSISMLLTFIGSVQMKLIPNEFTNPMPKDYDPWTKAPTKGVIPINFLISY